MVCKLVTEGRQLNPPLGLPGSPSLCQKGRTHRSTGTNGPRMGGDGLG